METSKPGRFGTIHLFAVTYRQENDSACPIMTWRTWAYDAEHAEMRFVESEDADGWEILSVKRVRFEHHTTRHTA